MKIVNSTELYEPLRSVNRRHMGKSYRKDSSDIKEDADSALVSISERSKELATVSTTLSETPDLRADKVARLKKLVQEGNYTIDPEKIAEKMIRHAIS